MGDCVVWMIKRATLVMRDLTSRRLTSGAEGGSADVTVLYSKVIFIVALSRSQCSMKILTHRNNASNVKCLHNTSGSYKNDFEHQHPSKIRMKQNSDLQIRWEYSFGRLFSAQGWQYSFFFLTNENTRTHSVLILYVALSAQVHLFLLTM